MICTSCSGTGGFLHCTNPECDCAPETCDRCEGFGGFCDECGKPSDEPVCRPCANTVQAGGSAGCAAPTTRRAVDDEMRRSWKADDDLAAIKEGDRDR